MRMMDEAERHAQQAMSGEFYVFTWFSHSSGAQFGCRSFAADALGR
jgi:hypothetical protein